MEGAEGRLIVSLLPEGGSDNAGIDSGNVDSTSTSSSGPAVTPLVILSTLVAVCGSFVSGCASAYSSPAESGIRDDLGISVAAYSLFGSILTVGAISASLINGWITDLIGRKRALWLSEAFSVVGWLLIVFAKNACWLDIGRILIGFGIGIICYVVPVYIAEITPKGMRGAFTALDQLLISCGFSVTYFVGTVVSWRILALVGFVPCVIQVIGLFFVPESPRWLVKVGREKEFEAVLQRLRGRNADTSEEADEIKDYTRTFEEQSKSRFLDLFQRRYAKPLTIGVGLMILQQLGGVNAFAYYSGSIFESADFSSSLGTQTIAIVTIPAVAVSVILTDKAGRRPLLMISAGMMFLCCLLLGISFTMLEQGHWKNVVPYLVYAGLTINAISFSIGVAPLPWVIMSEIFPINVKGSAGSLVTLANWFGSWVVTYAFNFLFEWSSSGVFYIFAGFCVANFLFIAMVVPETKGRTLEELQASLAHFRSPPTDFVRLDQDILSPLAGKKQLFTHETMDFWEQIKTPGMSLKCSGLYLAQFRFTYPHLLASGDGTKSASIIGDVYIHPSAKVHPTAKIGPNVSVSANARIGAGARLISCIVLDDVEIKENAVIIHSIVGWKSSIGKWSRVQGGGDYNAKLGITILGEGVTVEDEVVLINSIVLPHKTMNVSVQEEIIL